MSIDKTVGIQDFKNDRSLNDDQIATIINWIDKGAPKGDMKDMPAPAQWPEDQGWLLAKNYGQTEPDLVIHSTPWTQKAGANDTWWRPVVATGLTEDRWVRAIEIRPSTVRAQIAFTPRQPAADETDPLAQNDVISPAHQAGTFREWLSARAK